MFSSVVGLQGAATLSVSRVAVQTTTFCPAIPVGGSVSMSSSVLKLFYVGLDTSEVPPPCSGDVGDSV